MAVCVASQAKLDRTHLKLDLTGIAEMFPEHARFSSYSVARGKPHPDVFLHAASQMGSPPERCAVIEDSVSGVLGATSAGMTVFGYVPDGDRGHAAAGARTFTSMRDLPGLLLGA
jgi:beta-phosphoglucomutase-like phosphatase (HAD superfamily)